MKIHQIYYDFSMENKPMPNMFSELQKKVKLFASKNGYSYKFWNKKKIRFFIK